jgi:hypothetical protein
VRHFILVLVLAVVAIMMVACEQKEVSWKPQASQVSEESQANQGSNIDEEPLLLDDEPLLLLDDGEQEFLPPSGPVADNSRCHVCHINYMQEDIAVIHARANIGCADCHGQGDAHIADESWASGGNGTAPDIMFVPAKINPFCMGCHTKDKIDTEQHKPFFADSIKEKYCTDCHGDHRLTNRKCKWK